MYVCRLSICSHTFITLTYIQSSLLQILIGPEQVFCNSVVPESEIPGKNASKDVLLHPTGNNSKFLQGCILQSFHLISIAS